MKSGLLGRSLSHSYSPQIHAMLGNDSYELFEKEPEELGSFLRNGAWDGINVTVPYKKDVIPFLDELSPTAQKLGAVNTIIRQGKNLIGHNTDYFGFLTMVRAAGLDVAGKKALILGSGGASTTASAVLGELGANVVIISRTGPNHYENLSVHSDAALLVNTTPVGMFPHTDPSPVDLDILPNLEAVLDLIYNPARTKLLLDAENRGLTACNGLLMLVAQAKEAAEWFTGCKMNDHAIPAIYSTLRNQMENIVLIGMPGCGKSTVGQALAHKLSRQFVDADREIEKLAGMPITEIFSMGGENLFRQYETAVLRNLGMQSGLVMATGGGCVTKEQNYPLLHQNGAIFWLKRNPDLLTTEGRPLSQQIGVHELYHIRKHLYGVFADYIIDNDGNPADTVQQIAAIWEERT